MQARWLCTKRAMFLKLADKRRKMKQLQYFLSAILVLALCVRSAFAETCVAPLRPVLPNDPNALVVYEDLIRRDFVTYTEDMQRHFLCLETERARAFKEAEEVIQEYALFLERTEHR